MRLRSPIAPRIIPARPIMIPPVGKSGPGTISSSSANVISGSRSRRISPLQISARLCGGMSVAIPTAMPIEPLTKRLGNFAGSTKGSR